jgi:PPK2 family polyphosphate:nucleotide phosphotransferase
MKNITQLSTRPPAGADKQSCKKELKQIKEELFSLQNKFYADGRFGLLIILQGVDTSGKDGTIRHAFSGMNPMGIQVTSFKKPMGEECAHDFLWRIYPHFPARGMIRIFNRSYYEDILVPFVNKTLNPDHLRHRCHFINELEEHLSQNDFHLLKFILHISPEEQKERIAARKTKSHKKWKYDIADEEAPHEWQDYMQAYQLLVKNCSQHPWHIIPADKRWYRNFKVAETVCHHLKSLHLNYPPS